jgi:hypothetical protein
VAGGDDAKDYSNYKGYLKKKHFCKNFCNFTVKICNCGKSFIVSARCWLVFELFGHCSGHTVFELFWYIFQTFLIARIIKKVFFRSIARFSWYKIYQTTTKYTK